VNKPCETAYTVQALARLTGASVGQLRRWARSGLLPPDHRLGTSLRYRFADVIAARAARTLLQQGATTRNVREAVEAIRAWRPDVPNPLASLRLFAESGRLVVRIDDQLVDSRSGQLLLDLPLAEGPITAAVHTLVPATPRDADAWIAWAQEAERAGTTADVIGGRFRRALELDPLHPGALIGLGNVEYARGALAQARTFYERATQVAGEHPHPWYNLANVLDELGHIDAAASAYTAAVTLDPGFGDAHFNLALLWEKHGQRDRARTHWERVITLMAGSDSALLAGRFLSDDST
jgi:tetratricopeptide (TPR) repeat protein